MSVISIQSQVAYGHVGNSAAVFPMQMHGIDVIAVPTTLLSNRPGYPTIRGRVLEAQLVADLLLGVEERGALDTAEVILSGYLGSAEIAVVVADFVARAKARNPALIYCCDPVLGDRDRALFVHADIPPIVRDLLCPLVDMITPNHFEFEWLCGARATTIAQVIDAAAGGGYTVGELLLRQNLARAAERYIVAAVGCQDPAVRAHLDTYTSQIAPKLK